MTLLEQCEIWNDREEYQSIIDAIEALPKEERTPELEMWGIGRFSRRRQSC